MNKTKIFIFLGILLISGLFFVNYSLGQTAETRESLARLQGYILLQVEENGEAYYYNPEDDLRYFLGRPQDAFELMRSAGLGITNNDLNKIPIGITQLTGPDNDNDSLSNAFEDAVGTSNFSADSDGDDYSDRAEIEGHYNPIGEGNWSVDYSVINMLKGKVLLQVENNGEAWYVYPQDGKRYFLGRPHDAFEVMRRLGMGISNQNLNLIISDEDIKNCITQGNGIPVIADPPICCPGLSEIPPQDPEIIGISAICTDQCGNGVCDFEFESNYNCPQDCEQEEQCYEEGALLPLTDDFTDNECCPGLDLINPPDPQQLGQSGICTANCGDLLCDPETESVYNCPQDCEDQSDFIDDDFDSDQICYSEGTYIPLIPDSANCCSGLDLIDPKDPSFTQVEGLCTSLCGNGVCNSATESLNNCPQDCLNVQDCYGEGTLVPNVEGVPQCCAGLELIPPQNDDNSIVSGICTSKCGNGVCNPLLESNYNCPIDCL